MTEETKPSATATPAAPPKKKGLLRRLVKWSFVFFVFVLVLVIAFPAIASATFLTGTVRGALQKQFGAGAEVQKVALGWSSGLVIEKVKLPSSKIAAKDHPVAVDLEGVNVQFSLPAMIKAVLTHGEVTETIEVGKAVVYLELHPGGKTNLDMPESQPAASPGPMTSSQGNTGTSDTTTTAQVTSSEALELPCSATATLNVKSIDLEIADMTSSTGVVQRTVLKNLHAGFIAHVDRDTSAQLKTLDEKDATVSFDDCTVTQETPGKPPVLVIEVEKPRVVTPLVYAGHAPKSAEQAPIKAVAKAHQVNATPTIDVPRIHGDGFDLRTLAIHATAGNQYGKQKLHATISGVLKGDHEGGITLETTADLDAGKGKLPASYELHLDKVDISGAVAKTLNKVLPVLGGTDKGGKQQLPQLSFDTTGTAEVRFKADDSFDKDPTLKTIAQKGGLKTGPGSFDGSAILQGLGQAFEKLQLKDVLDKAVGGQGLFAFDGVTETFHIENGVVTIDKLDLARQGFGLSLSGTVDFSGHYRMAIHFVDAMYAKLDPDVAKVLKCVDKAGGIGVDGTLDGGCSVATPPGDVLAKAMLEGGALDILRARNPKAAAQLDGYLGKAGTSVDKIVNDPAQAAKDTAKDQATKQADKVVDKNKDKIEKATGMDAGKIEGGLKGVIGGGDDKKPDDKKDDKPLFKNPFGG
ncbi:MAG TPA: AsmA-like C-terminal region-containing protein [Planctomycetota bacterium]|nr:AsmA-like C-terminal region-containing protein [Planctomycetota bacterium]